MYDGLICEGYEKCLFFDSEGTEASNVIRYRRPLFTKREREDMSLWLMSSIKPNQVMSALSRIDQETLNADQSRSLWIYHGPFGVLRFGQDNVSPSSTPSTSSTKEIEISYDSSVQDDDNQLTFETAFWEWTQDSCEPFSQWSDLRPDELQLIEDQTPHTSDTIFASLFEKTDTSQDAIQPRPVSRLRSLTPQQMLSMHTPLNLTTFTTGTPPSDTENSISPLGEGTGILIRHYATAIIGAFTPFHHTKTPWHILFLPNARNSVASLTLGDPIDHASLSTLYGILAMSAFSLGITTVTQSLLVQARTYEIEARKQTDLMLNTAYKVPKVSKYKSILMGLITMAMVSIAFGQQAQAESHLLEAEKFIRLKGLNRNKSRKVRLLHHCYVYVRIFHESTFGRVADFKQRQRIRKAIESDKVILVSRDGLSFRLTGWSDLDKEMVSVRSKDDHENDLHLGIPSLHHASLYPEVTGIPEPWFYIFSQVIRLGNEKDGATAEEESTPLTMKEFLDRSNAIERWIHELSRWSKTRGLLEAYEGQSDPSVLHSVFDMMVCALSIYFYRRIYNVNASVLQQKVIMIRDYLLESLATTKGVVPGCVGYIWPAFIAACEAGEDDIRAAFSNWFKDCAFRSGLLCFAENLQIVEKVWQARDEAQGANVSWLDIMKRENA